jgi:hypothetical protein
MPSWIRLPTESPTKETPLREKLLKLADGDQEQTLINNILAFSRLLRRAEMDVTTPMVIDVCRSINYIDLSNRTDFYSTLRTNLVARYDEFDRFDTLFRVFWGFSPQNEEKKKLKSEPSSEAERRRWWDKMPKINPFRRGREKYREDRRRGRTKKPVSDEKKVQQVLYKDFFGGQHDEKAEQGAVGYSAIEILQRKDFSTFSDADLGAVRELIAQLAPKLATALSRRTRISAKGNEIDLRRSFRANLKYGGDIIELTKRRKRIKKLKVILICDVSGSMERYSRFFVQFVYGLQNALSGIETFVFSTSLTEVTQYLKGKPFRQALFELSDAVPDWSGGTRIGDCIWAFNEQYAASRLTKRTLVVIISDGEDMGDSKFLSEQMAILKRRCYRVMWLNPLLGRPGYKPRAQGMVAALPYTDLFLPADDLDSMVQLTRAFASFYNVN